jgi:hypothetical protein
MGSTEWFKIDVKTPSLVESPLLPRTLTLSEHDNKHLRPSECESYLDQSYT